MSKSSDQYGVIGYPVAHSWSPFIHGLFARQTGQDLTYRLFEVPPAKFRKRVVEFFLQGGRGLNVTVPHKLVAAEFANTLTPRAERAGAVNTLALQDADAVLGDNTDGAGLVRDLKDNLGIAVTSQRVLLIGAGGAARGVLPALLELDPKEIVVVNRTPERARELAQDFADLGTVRGCGFKELTEESFNLVINGTSASLSGEIPAIPSTVVDKNTVCYDMAYGKSATPFMCWAVERGCARALPGWGMLVEQAAESFALWRGVRPETAPVLAALTERAQL